jgi:5-methylcytosine-specific restriction endonuclease McrA
LPPRVCQHSGGAARTFSQKVRAMPMLPGFPADPQPETRRCTKCGEVKAIADYYRKSPDRLMSHCKACHRVITEAYRKTHPELYAECAKKYRDADPEKARAVNKASRERHYERIRQRERAVEATPEYRSKKAAYRKAKTAHRKAYNAAYARANADRIRERNRRYRKLHPELYVAAVRKWQARNPLKAKVIKANAHARRRAREAAAIGSYTAAEWEFVKAAQEYRCLICGMYEPLIKLTVDHVIPLSKGGTNTADNLAGLCGPCNSHKRDRMIDPRLPGKIGRPNRRPRRSRQTQ